MADKPANVATAPAAAPPAAAPLPAHPSPRPPRPARQPFGGDTQLLPAAGHHGQRGGGGADGMTNSGKSSLQHDDSERFSSVASSNRSERSETSRQSLRRDLQRMRKSLTIQQANFLDDLVINGNEIEVQLAHENLQNLLKFEDLDVDDEEDEDDVDTQGWANTNVIRVGNERSQSLTLNLGETELSDLDDNSNRELSQTGSNASDTMSKGSEMRLGALEERRNNLLFGKMWKAHQSGLAVSKASSRRSLFARHSLVAGMGMKDSSNASGASRRELFQRSRGDIFRSRNHFLPAASRRLSSSSKKPMGDIKSDNMSPRRSSIASLRDLKNISRHSKSSSLVFEPGTASALRHTLGMPAPPLPNQALLRRMGSDGTRKSVTFGALPYNRRSTTVPNTTSSGRIFSEGEISSISEHEEVLPFQVSDNIRKSMPVRRDSNSSIPSIHQAHPISSPSVTSLASIPSIHHARPLRSESFRSSSGNFSAAAASAISSLGEKDPLDLSSITSRASDNQLHSDEKKSEDSSQQVIVSQLPPEVEGGEEDVTPLLHNKKRPILTRDASVGVGIEIEKLKSPDTSKPIAEVELPRRPVLMRDASKNVYMGEGIEIADFVTSSKDKKNLTTLSHSASRLESLVSFGEASAEAASLDDDSDILMLHHCDTFDETMSYGRVSSIFRRSIRRSLSDDDMAGIFLGGSRLMLRESSSLREVFITTGGECDADSWLMDDESELDYYDSWKVIEDEYENGYGGGGTLPFLILGTSADDADSCPHVLSPPLMESLSEFIPLSNSGDSFWLKYSLVRDGASMHTFLQHARGAKCSFLAVETIDGEVFGAFTTEPWRKNWNHFGGYQSFLWRMRHDRRTKCHSIIDQAQKESEIDVYPYASENNCIQLCTHDRIAVGGGHSIETSSSFDPNLPGCESPIKEHEWGFGLSLERDLLTGSTSPCITFRSPSLSKIHSDGSQFEVINVELWTLTPCMTEEEAEKLELGRLFLEANANSNHKFF